MNCRVAFNGTEWIIYLDREGVEFLHECLLESEDDEDTKAALSRMSDAYWEAYGRDYDKVITPILKIREAYTQ